MSKIDIGSYIDYFIAEMFFANKDWPFSNHKLWIKNEDDAQWRWIFYDIDAGFSDINRNMFELCNEYDEDVTYPNPPETTFLYRNLIKNDDFVERFQTRFAELLKTKFHRDSTEQKVLMLKKMYEKEIDRHQARWSYPRSVQVWEDSIKTVILDFLRERPCAIEDQIMGFFEFDDFAFSCSDTIYTVKKNDTLTLYPNPTYGLFYVYNKSPDSLTLNLRIRDLRGKTVYSEDRIVFERFGSECFNIDLSKPNVYIMTFYNKEFIEHKKVIFSE